MCLTAHFKFRAFALLLFLLDFAQRIGAQAKAVSTEELEDLQFISLIDTGLNTESVSRDEIMKALRQ